MAAKSISQVLSSRRKIRALTICAGLVLAFFLFQLLVVKNPWNAKAAIRCDSAGSNGECVISANQTITEDMINRDIIITGSGTTVTVSGARNFRNLTIKDNATLTHAAILTTDVGADRYTLTPAGLNKKVDLTLSGDLTIQNGGQIYVTGKGYPGGSPTTQTCLFQPPGCVPILSEDGWGSGRGEKSATNVFGAGGAGYGGRGGEGKDSDDNGVITGKKGGISYGTATDPDDPGSGGGGGERVTGSGGNGGGVVKIQAARFVFSSANAIVANGDPGGVDAGGGGSGGSINLKGGTFIVNNLSTILSARGGMPGLDRDLSSWWTQPGGAGGGGRVSVVVGTLEYAGGATQGSFASRIDTEWGWPTGWTRSNFVPIPYENQHRIIAGEQGTINIEGNGSGSSSTGTIVKKKLIAVQRAGANNSSYNPYALQLGDVVKVEMTVSSITVGVPIKVKDNFLNITAPGSKNICTPNVGGALVSNVVNANNVAPIMDDVSISYGDDILNPLIPTLDPVTITYQCTVIAQ